MNEHRRHPRSKTSSGQAEPLIQTVARTIGHAAGKLTRLTQEFVGKTASGASDLSQSPECISHPIEISLVVPRLITPIVQGEGVLPRRRRKAKRNSIRSQKPTRQGRDNSRVQLPRKQKPKQRATRPGVAPIPQTPGSRSN